MAQSEGSLLKAHKFLTQLAEAGAFSANLNSLINGSRGSDVADFELKDKVLVARAYVGGKGSYFRFVDNLTEKKPGVCNFDKGKLNPNEAFIITSASIQYGEAGDATSPGLASYGDKAPIGIRNSEFRIKQAGREVLSDDTATLINPFGDSSTNESDNWKEFGKYMYLNDMDTQEWGFEVPNGYTIPADSNNDYPYIEVRLRGYMTSKREL